MKQDTNSIKQYPIKILKRSLNKDVRTARELLNMPLALVTMYLPLVNSGHLRWSYKYKLKEGISISIVINIINIFLFEGRYQYDGYMLILLVE